MTALADTIKEIQDLLTSIEALRGSTKSVATGEGDVIRAAVTRIINRYLGVDEVERSHERI